MNRLSFIFIVTFFITICYGQQYTIKFASIAPEGSTWMNVMKELDAAIRKESGGRLGFRMYPSGVQGMKKQSSAKLVLDNCIRQVSLVLVWVR